MTKIRRKFWELLLIIRFLTISSVFGNISTDYCFVTCILAENFTHIVCERRHECGPVKDCTEIESDENFRRHILHQHNEVRNSVANGSDKGTYGNTGAKNMHALSYDMELEYIAACSTNMCGDGENDSCSDSLRFPVGKNSVYGTIENWTAEAVPEFYRRIAYITDAEEIHEYRPVRDDLLHMESFLRLVWADTKYVGCSRSIKRPENGESMLTCLYGPAFYVKGKPVYKMAKNPSEIASECKDGRNREYNALCGEMDAVPVRAMWTHIPLNSFGSVRSKLVFNVFCGVVVINLIVNTYEL